LGSELIFALDFNKQPICKTFSVKNYSSKALLRLKIKESYDVSKIDAAKNFLFELGLNAHKPTNTAEIKQS